MAMKCRFQFGWDVRMVSNVWSGLILIGWSLRGFGGDDGLARLGMNGVGNEIEGDEQITCS